MGSEQAWTPILNLTTPLCKLLALRDLSAIISSEPKHTKGSLNICVTLVVMNFSKHSVTPIKSKCLSMTKSKKRRNERM